MMRNLKFYIPFNNKEKILLSQVKKIKNDQQYFFDYFENMMKIIRIEQKISIFSCSIP
jgi:hypothetical protein